MKKLILFLCASLFAVSVFAADNNIPGVMLQDKGGLYNEVDGKMEWIQSLDAGTELKVITVTDDNGKQVPETTESKRIVNKKEVKCTCYHVIYENQKFWVLTDRISMNESVAAVITPCAIYRSPDIADMKNSSLPIGDIITIGKKFTANGKFSLYKITYFDSINYETRSGYVMEAKVSDSEKDLKALRMIAKIKNSKDESIRAELYANTKKLSMAEPVAQYLEDVMNSFNDPLVTEGYSDLSGFAYVINDDETSPINVRITPGKKGEVVGQIATTTVVQIIQVTNAEDTIENITRPWYKLVVEETGLEGWVFGAYVSFFE